jgi:hypothetical protein
MAQQNGTELFVHGTCTGRLKKTLMKTLKGFLINNEFRISTVGRTLQGNGREVGLTHYVVFVLPIPRGSWFL